MKKILFSILLVFLIFIFAGCGSETLDSSENAETVDVSTESIDNSSQKVDLSTYFDADTVSELTEFSNVSGINLSTNLFDEDCELKPMAVLFFTVDSLDEKDAENDYYKKVNNGGCIEIFEDITTAKRRNDYLTGFFFFGLTGGKHDVVNKYVIQMSKDLSDEEQQNIINELTKILGDPEEDASVSLPTDSTNQQAEETTKSANTAGAPDVWTNLLEKHYEEVKKQFEDAGFTNIICVAHEVDYDENKVFEGSIINIAIGENGEICTFEKGEQWPTDVKIRIDYRVKPIVEENSDSSTTMPQSSTDNNPYNKVTTYSVYTENEYAHIDSDVIRLGNNERVWITIKASPSNLSADDFIVDYDDTMLEIVDITSSTTGNVLEIELTIKAKKAGVSEIIICSGYEIYEEAENADCYVLTVNGLDSSDGRIVYVTSSGEKYHFSSSCVDNGIKTTLDDALAYDYEPCGKCAK